MRPNLRLFESATAAFARAASTHEQFAIALPVLGNVPVEVQAQSIVEGVLLSRYAYTGLRGQPKGKSVRELTLLANSQNEAAVRAGAERGRVFATATMLARDLGNTPHSHLTATRLADIAVTLGSQRGFEVEVFDKGALIRLGCGGLLGVNAGSVEPPRMIKLTYRPEQEPTGRLALVGKGVMYDSGGLSLKPSDMVHARMKNDMAGAAAVLAVFSALSELHCTAMVTGFLMCTDNNALWNGNSVGRRADHPRGEDRRGDRH